MKKINLYDFIKIKITYCHKDKNKEKSEILEGYYGISKFPEYVEKAIQDHEIDEQNNIIFKEKKQKYIIEVLKQVPLNKDVIKELNKKHKFEDLFLKEQNSVQKLKDKINDLQKEIIEQQNLFLKQASELQSKAQSQISEHKQKTDIHYENQLQENKKYALQNFFEELILPLNNFELAIGAAQQIDNDVVKNFARGFAMLYSQIENVLKDAGIKKIIPQIGEKFNPDLHQVFEVVKSDEDKDTILEVKNIGYQLNERVIKPALIVVAG